MAGSSTVCVWVMPPRSLAESDTWRAKDGAEISAATAAAYRFRFKSRSSSRCLVNLLDFLLKPQKGDVLEVKPTSQTEAKLVNLPEQSRELSCRGIKAYLPVIELLSKTKVHHTFRGRWPETTLPQCLTHNVQGTSEFMRPAKKWTCIHNQEKKAVHRRRPTAKPCADLVKMWK